MVLTYIAPRAPKTAEFPMNLVPAREKERTERESQGAAYHRSQTYDPSSPLRSYTNEDI